MNMWILCCTTDFQHFCSHAANMFWCLQSTKCLTRHHNWSPPNNKWRFWYPIDAGQSYAFPSFLMREWVKCWSHHWTMTNEVFLKIGGKYETKIFKSTTCPHVSMIEYFTSWLGESFFKYSILIFFLLFISYVCFEVGHVNSNFVAD